MALPLPPGWEMVLDSYGELRYMAREYSVLMEESPALAFMQKLVSRGMSGSSMERPILMRFYDKHMLPYMVDLSILDRNDRSYRLQTHSLTYIREIQTKSLYRPNAPLWSDILHGKLLLELALTAGVNLDTELHLLGFIDRFLRSCKKQGVFKTWAYRCPLQGQGYWYNSVQESTFTHFPYTKSLIKYVQKRKSKAEKRSLERIKANKERHSYFERFGEEFEAVIIEGALRTMRIYVENWVEEEVPLEKPSVCLSGVLGSEGRLDHPLDLLFANPYRLSDLPSRLYPDDKDARLSTDSESEQSSGVPLTWETITRVSNLPDKKTGGGLFTNKKLLRVKAEVRRKVVRSRTFKPTQQDKEAMAAVINKRVRSSQELRGPISLIEEYEETESPSSESESDMEFSEEEEEEAGEGTEERQEEMINSENTLAYDQLQTEPQEDFDTADKLIEPLTETYEKKDTHQELIPSNQPLTLPVAPLPAPVPALPDIAAVGKDDSNTERSQQHTSSNGARSGLSSRASKHLIQSRTNSRPGTGLLIAGQQPLLPDPTRTLKREPTRHWPLLPSTTMHSTVAGDTLPPLKESSQSLSDLTDIPPVKPKSRQSSAVSSSSPQEVPSPSDPHKHSMSRSMSGRSGLLPQFPLPPLVPIAENKPEHHISEIEESNKANRKLFGKYSDAVVGSFFSLVEDTHEKKAAEQSQELVDAEAEQEAEEAKAQLTSWLASKDVMTGLGKLFLPVIKADVPGQTLPAIRRDSQLFPTVYGRNSIVLSSGDVSPAAKKAMLLTPQRRESFLITETPTIKVSALNSRRVSMMVRRPSVLSPTFDSKSPDSLAKDFILSPNQRSEAPVFIAPPKPAVPLTTQRVQSFLHYLDKVGFPMSTQGEVRTYPSKHEILPMHVIKMGKRLGMNVTSQKYNSAESDLLWIALLQLTAPLPPYFRLSLPQQLVLLPFKNHPGDEYFLLMSDFNRKLRRRELDQLSKADKVKSVVNESWLCLTTRLNVPYLYNFLTGERIVLNKAQTTTEQVDISKDKRIKMLKEALEEQLDTVD